MDIETIKSQIWNCTITFEQLDDFFGNKEIDQSNIIVNLLAESLGDKNGDAVEYLIYAAEKNGVNDSYHDILCKLLSVREDWQYKHEDIATLLGKIKSPKSIPFLFQLAEDYETSDIHSIPLKAMWSLRAIGNTEAIESLERIAKSRDERKSKIAKQQIEYLKEKEAST